jgi:hypothetical protein
LASYLQPGTSKGNSHDRDSGVLSEVQEVHDRTVLVKEVFSTDHARLTTGDPHLAKGTKHWFVMIKDEKGAFQEIRYRRWVGRAHCEPDAPDKQVATD